MSENDNCPLAQLGEESFNPATCTALGAQNIPCPYMKYHEHYRNCNIYVDWLKKIIRVNENQREAELQGGETPMHEEGEGGEEEEGKEEWEEEEGEEETE